MTLIPSGNSRALLRACALFLCIVCAGICAPSTARSGMVPPVLRAANASLLPDLQYFIDVTGTMDVEEAAAPANNQMFKPLKVKELPRVAGVMWLRFTLAPVPAGGRSQAMLLDLGPDIPADPVLYEPAASQTTDSVEWREIPPSHRNVLLLPEAGAEPVTCYIRLDGLPGIWFSPTLRTPQDAASNWGSLSGTAALLALGVVMLLCLLRGLSERGQWRIWTALYVGVALLQGVLGMPAYGSGHITLNQSLALLAPGLALMLLPHVGRHLMRTRGRSPMLDAQFILLSLPGAALALLPLFPGFGWSIRFLSLWPACTAIFTLSALGGAIMGLGGSRRFLLGCIVPPLFVAAGVMGLDYGYAANLLASAPLWGTALSALIIAGTGSPRDAAQGAADQPNTGSRGKSRGAKRESASLDAALVSSSFGANDGPINLDAPLDDPNLRLLPPSASMGKTAADFSALPVDIADNSDQEPLAARAGGSKKPAAGVDPGMWENLLRPSLDRLMREGAALSHCSLPPAVRQYAENMLGAAGDLAKIIDNPGKELEQTSVGEQRTSFNLQHLVREAHDAVTTAAENAGIGLAWYMPPLLGHMYEGQARALRDTICLLLESAVRATSRGAVHLSVRRVPETADPGHLLFTVTDTGAGIPPRDRSSLALTRAWELAGSNSGYLNVECGPQGTSIAFTLRLKPLENEAGSEAAAEPLRAPTITVVAESAVDRQALAHMITTLGCNSSQARSMREALECNREAPALMLVVQDPNDGPAEADSLGRFEAEAIKAGLPVFKALAVTSNNSRWDALAEIGYTHALLEPVDMEAFAATLREVLDEAGFAEHGPAATSLAASPDAPETPEATADATGVDTVDAAPAHAPLEDTLPLIQQESAQDTEPLPAVDAPREHAQQQGILPDLFGHDAPAQDGLPGKAASAAVQSLELPLPHEDLLPSARQPQSFAAADPSGMLLPMMEDSTLAEDDEAPIELTELLPPETAGQADDLILPVVEAEPVALVAVEPASAEAAPAEVEPVAEQAAAPTKEPEADAAQPEPQAESQPTPEVMLESAPEVSAEVLADVSAEVSAEIPADVLADVSAADRPQEKADDAPQQEASQAPVDSAAEFMASAGLEGPLWAAEEPALAQPHETEAQEPAAPTAEANSAQEAAELEATPESSSAPALEETEQSPVLADEDSLAEAPLTETAPAETSQVATAQEEAPQEEAALAEVSPADIPAEEAPAPLERLDWPEPAPHPDHATAPREVITPAEFLEAALPSQPDEAASQEEQPAEESADALKAMTGRAGEATLSPVNTSGFDVPAPAGRGAWDTYSLQDEWVGEPMPIGTPTRASTPAQPAAPQVSAGESRSAASASPVRQEKKSYVSPSLAHPGEWVGEPMPITKPAQQEELPVAPQQNAGNILDHVDDSRGRQVEMPRTATGRLILKLLGSAGDRPADDDSASQSGKLDLKDTAGGASQNTPLAQLLPDDSAFPVSTLGADAPAAPAEPRRAATPLKSVTKGNSIMNFIAGAAEALRSTGHDHARQPQPGDQPFVEAEDQRTPSMEQTGTRPQAADFAPQYEGAAPVMPQPPVQPVAPREVDQTIPQLVVRLDAAMDDAQQGFKNRRCAVVGDAANRIATESDAFGFRVLARMARCVERAAKANDMNALRDLLPELAVAVERNRIGLTPRR